MPDSELRAKVTPDYTIGCKRIILSDTLYPALSAPNTTLHDRHDGIVRFDATGIVTASGEHLDLDVVVFSTGYDATDGLIPYEVRGRDGARLADFWHEFPRAYLGAFIDQHLLDLFKRLEWHGHPRILYLEDVIFEHMHFRSGKGDFDQIYGNRGRFADDDIFLGLRAERSAAAGRLQAAIEGRTPAAEKKTSVGESFLDATLLDRDISPARRAKLFFWLLARRAARKVL